MLTSFSNAEKDFLFFISDFCGIILPHTLLKLRLESLDVGFYAIAPFARFASSGTKFSSQKMLS